VDFISKKKPDGYFYYVMELGDGQKSDWWDNPTSYKPRDLYNACKQVPGGRLPLPECLRIGTILAEALSFLHEQGFTHRDIKPQNVIFVDNTPKLSDVGLVAEIRPTEQITTYVGSTGYAPPPPEPPGTVQADIYAFGKLLYVISTGRDPESFPELSPTLFDQAGNQQFSQLNAIINKACQPERKHRYKTAAELLDVLREALRASQSS
jgi:serine/threonine protein kinase